MFLATAAFGLALAGSAAAIAQEVPAGQAADVSVAPPAADVSVAPPSTDVSDAPRLSPDVRTGLSGRVVLTSRCPVPLGGDDGGVCPTIPMATTVGVRSADGTADVAQVATDADGQFSVALDPGQYQVVVPAPGGGRFPAQTLPVTVLADGPTNLTIQVRPGPHIVP